MKDALQTAVEKVVVSRKSIRAFRNVHVSDEEVLSILNVAAKAPSGTNTQPWRAYVLRSHARNELVSRVSEAYDSAYADPARASEYSEEYDYYPAKWFEPYLQRRRQNGYELYGLLGIAKGDKAAMHAQHGRNFRFFDAPVGLFFTLHRGLGRGSILDYGMFLQNVMLVAKSRGLDTCPQAAWNRFSSIILPFIGAGPDEMLLCAIALGVAEELAEENKLQSPRADAASFTTFLA